MDEMRAMLDQLMGSDRNLSTQEKQKVKPKKRKFTDPDVCKYFLCGFCPYEEFRRTKNDLGECPSVHDEACKADWEALDEKDKEYYGYERDLLRKLERLLSDLHRRMDANQRRLEATQKPSADDLDAIEHCNGQINDILGKAGELGELGDIDAAEALMKEADGLKEKKIFIEKKFEAKTGSHVARGLVQSVCPVSGLIINDEESRLRDHHAGRNYNAWKKLHEMHAMLCDLMAKRSGGRSRGSSPSRRGDRRSSRRDGRSRSRSRSRSRDRRRRRRSRSRSRTRSRSRSRSRSRDRYRDRKSHRSSRGRSREKDGEILYKEKYGGSGDGAAAGAANGGGGAVGGKEEEERNRSPEEGEVQ